MVKKLMPVQSYKRCGHKRLSRWVEKIPGSRKWQPTPVFLPGESHAKRRLMGYSPWGHKESDMIEILSTHIGFIGRAGR